MRFKLAILLLFSTLFSFGQLPEYESGFVIGAGVTPEFLELDDQYSKFIAGSFSGTKDFNPGPGEFNLTAYGGKDCFIEKFDSLGNFLWAGSIRSASDIDLNHFSLTADGGILLVGEFSGLLDVDPDTSTWHVINSGNNKGNFVIRLDGSGNFLWAKALKSNSNGSIIVNDAVSDDHSNVFLTGSFRGSVDVDPDSTQVLETSQGGKDIFLLRLNYLGHYSWHRTFGSVSYQEAFGIDIDPFKNIIVSGVFSDTVDFDPGLGVHFLAAPTGRDGFVCQFDQQGDFNWGANIHGNLNNFLIHSDNAGNIYGAGSFLDSIQFFPNTWHSAVQNPGNQTDIFCVKIDNSGTVKYGYGLGNSLADDVLSLSSDELGNFYLAGRMGGPGAVDMDPFSGVNLIGGISSSFGFVAKFRESGTLDFAFAIDGYSHDLLYGSRAMDNKLTIVGHSYGNPDFDPGPGFSYLNFNNANRFGFLADYSMDSCLNGFFVELDSQRNISCFSPGFVALHGLGLHAPFTYHWQLPIPVYDSATTFTVRGLKTVEVSDTTGCTRSLSFLIDGPEVQNDVDLKINLIQSIFVPGVPARLDIDVYNDGCQPISGLVSMSLDPLFIVDSLTIPPLYTNGDTLFWSVHNLIYDSPHFKVSLFGRIDSSAVRGEFACFDVQVTPLLDSDTTNNQKSYCFRIRGAYDPNDKKVFPKGKCEEGYIEVGQTLTYTVRFQNVGDAPAYNVVILDTLDPALDLNTFRIAGQSHEPIFSELLPGRVLKLSFPAIYLPDSSSDEAGSQGYVLLETDLIDNLPQDYQLKNRAAIFFDLNEPILTNRVENMIVGQLPDVDFSINPLNGGWEVVAANASFQWVDCNNGFSPIPGDTLARFFPSGPGSYAVLVSKDGCSEYSKCFSVLSTSKPLSLGGIHVFPNPSQGEIRIDGLISGTSYMLRIYDLNGIQLVEKSLEGTTDCSIRLDRRPGTYILKLTSNGESVFQKLILH